MLAQNHWRDTALLKTPMISAKRLSMRILLTLLLITVACPAAEAQESQLRAGGFKADEAKVIKHCLALTHACQLDDGAIVQVGHGGAAAAPALVVPYFAHHVALAWLVAYERSKNIDELRAAERWLQWCAAHQTAEGYWNHWDGVRRDYKELNVCDAWDSSASLYLCVLEKFQRAGGEPSDAMIKAASRALRCLEKLLSPDGLTFAKPTYRVMYLMDNVETIFGARSAERFFAHLKREDEQRRSAALAATVSAAIPSFWMPKNQIFAWARHPNGKFDSGLKTIYPDGLAQLFGVAFVRPSTKTFAATSHAFSPETHASAAAGAERWLMAAARVGGPIESDWRRKIIADGREIGPDVYSYRPALVILALLEGADWAPSVAKENPPN